MHLKDKDFSEVRLEPRATKPTPARGREGLCPLVGNSGELRPQILNPQPLQWAVGPNPKPDP